MTSRTQTGHILQINKNNDSTITMLHNITTKQTRKNVYRKYRRIFYESITELLM